MFSLSFIIIATLLLDVVAGRWPNIEFVYIHKLNALNVFEADPRDPVIVLAQIYLPANVAYPTETSWLHPMRICMPLITALPASRGFQQINTASAGVPKGQIGEVSDVARSCPSSESGGRLDYPTILGMTRVVMSRFHRSACRPRHPVHRVR